MFVYRNLQTELLITYQVETKRNSNLSNTLAIHTSRERERDRDAVHCRLNIVMIMIEIDRRELVC